MCRLCGKLKKEVLEMKVIECNKCSALTDVPFLPNVIELMFFDCPSLRTISGQLGLVNLICTNCPSLVSVDSPNLRTLACEKCKRLESLSGTTKLKHFTAIGCPLLTRVPEMPKLKYVRHDCPGLSVPKRVDASRQPEMKIRVERKR